MQTQERIQILIDQKNDLKLALIYMVEQVLNGKMSYRPFYQLKMYNDPTYNPYLKK